MTKEMCYQCEKVYDEEDMWVIISPEKKGGVLKQFCSRCCAIDYLKEVD